MRRLDTRQTTMHGNSPLITLALCVALFCGCSRQDPPAADATRPANSAANPLQPDQPDLRQILARPARPAADRRRDAQRKPAEVVEFLGIEPGDKVIDLIAAGGYYSEVLSIAVGPQGQVVAQNPDAVLQLRGGANDKALSARLADNRLPNITRLDRNFQEMEPADGKFDVALTALNFHDVYNGSGTKAAVAVLGSVRALLRADGVLGIIDHQGAADTNNRPLHRIEKRLVIDLAQQAGFELAGDSDLLRNIDDDLSRSVFDDDLRGRTDRFLLKFRKAGP